MTETSIKYKAAPGHIAVLHEALDSSGGIYLKSPQMSLQILDASICLITVLLKRTQTENSLLSLKRMVKQLGFVSHLDTVRAIRLLWHMKAEQWESCFGKSHMKYTQKLVLKGIAKKHAFYT